MSITQYRGVATDANGQALYLGAHRGGSELRTSDGAFTPIDRGTSVIRVATDVTIHMNTGGGQTTVESEILPAGDVEYFAVRGGEVFNIIEVV